MDFKKLALLADLVYSDKNCVTELEKTGFTDVEFHKTKGDLECVLAKEGYTIYIAFRGTEASLKDIKTDFKFSKTDFEGFKAHKGFVKSYSEIRDEVVTYVNGKLSDLDILRGGKIVILGHSLGGALANLCAVHLVTSKPYFAETIQLVTFGSPKVFGYNYSLFKIYNSIETYRFVNGDDLVTKAPPMIFNYFHYGNEVNIGNKDGSGILKEHGIKKYYESLSV